MTDEHAPANPEPWQLRMASSFRAVAHLLEMLEPDDARFLVGMLRRRMDLLAEEDNDVLGEVSRETLRRMKIKREQREATEGIE